ncbi:MAG TPA: isochorismatase family cysteine hydrolase [Polyangiaceae bacterium]|nr:isochorismatase family cysteine hydrolase [Polyangiaceae bacterium]
MAATTLDPVSALIVIDMQKGIVALPTVHPAAEITERVAQLARAFRQHGLPVILVNVAGGSPGRTEVTYHFTPPSDWAELIPELEQHPDDHTVTKLQWGAFHGTSLDHFLRRRGVTQVVLAGISTSIGVESSARSAHDLGYHVTLVVDAMTDLDADAHQHSVAKIFPRLGETATTEEALNLLRTTSKGLPQSG